MRPPCAAKQALARRSPRRQVACRQGLPLLTTELSALSLRKKNNLTLRLQAHCCWDIGLGMVICAYAHQRMHVVAAGYLVSGRPLLRHLMAMDTQITVSE
jgi:hypothetical protein